METVIVVFACAESEPLAELSLIQFVETPADLAMFGKIFEWWEREQPFSDPLLGRSITVAPRIST